MPTRNDAFPSLNLNAEDLPLNQPVRVTIKAVVLANFKDGTSKYCLEFAGKSKRLPLNLTNWNRMVAATGQADCDHWVGYTITLQREMVDYQGKRVAAVRINDGPGMTTSPGTSAGGGAWPGSQWPQSTVQQAAAQWGTNPQPQGSAAPPFDPSGAFGPAPVKADDIPF